MPTAEDSDLEEGEIPQEQPVEAPKDVVKRQSSRSQDRSVPPRKSLSYSRGVQARKRSRTPARSRDQRRDALVQKSSSSQKRSRGRSAENGSKGSKKEEDTRAAVLELTQNAGVPDTMRSLDTVCRRLELALHKLLRFQSQQSAATGTDDSKQLTEMVSALVAGLRSVHVVINTAQGLAADPTAPRRLFRTATTQGKQLFSSKQRQTLADWVQSSRALREESAAATLDSAASRGSGTRAPEHCANGTKLPPPPTPPSHDIPGLSEPTQTVQAAATSATAATPAAPVSTPVKLAAPAAELVTPSITLPARYDLLPHGYDPFSTTTPSPMIPAINAPQPAATTVAAAAGATDLPPGLAAETIRQAVAAQESGPLEAGTASADGGSVPCTPDDAAAAPAVVDQTDRGHEGQAVSGLAASATQLPATSVDLHQPPDHAADAASAQAASAPSAAPADLPSEAILSSVNTLLKRKQLCLVLDLDHTLVNSTRFSEVNTALQQKLRALAASQGGESQLFELPHIQMWTKLRPGIHDFLRRAQQNFELWIHTNGSRSYALAVVELLDPSGNLFGPRIIAQGGAESGEALTLAKSLKAGLEGRDMVSIVVDDLSHVWAEHPENLFLVEPYVYFPGQRASTALLEVERDEVAERGMLRIAMDALLQVHRAVFEALSTPPTQQPDGTLQYQRWDVPYILGLQRTQVLQGVRILFSRIIPLEEEPSQHPLWVLAERFGASCTAVTDPDITHLVTNTHLTMKAQWARDRGKHIVTASWLKASCTLWKRANEADFPVVDRPQR